MSFYSFAGKRSWTFKPWLWSPIHNASSRQKSLDSTSVFQSIISSHCRGCLLGPVCYFYSQSADPPKKRQNMQYNLIETLKLTSELFVKRHLPIIFLKLSHSKSDLSPSISFRSSPVAILKLTAVVGCVLACEWRRSLGSKLMETVFTPLCLWAIALSGCTREGCVLLINLR